MSTNPDSILDSIKQTLGLDPEFTAFDLEMVMYINSAFGSLQQLGVGPTSGFTITDNTKVWSQYLLFAFYLDMVKQFISLSVKLVFDPPDTSFAIGAIKSSLAELTWRINVAAESNPSFNPSSWWDLTGFSDFPPEASTGDYGYDANGDHIYVNTERSIDGYWWDLTDLDDFPDEALVGEFGYYPDIGTVWRKTG
jgi:hypothetical protein